MTYTIKEVAERFKLQQSTLRYYEQEGILVDIARNTSGNRVFSEDNVAMIELIECLKNTGLSIKGIKEFSQWIEQGDDSLVQRHKMFLERRIEVLQQMEVLEKTLAKVNEKCLYYEKAVAAQKDASNKNLNHS